MAGGGGSILLSGWKRLLARPIALERSKPRVERDIARVVARLGLRNVGELVAGRGQ